MKNISIISIFIIIILSLSAWGIRNLKSNSSGTNTSVESNSISPTMELAIGTLRLEGTSQTVDKKSAAQLLPYWQLMEELYGNSAAASQEKSAVVENIQALMTAEQVEAIKDMKLTQSDVSSALQTSTSESEVSNTNTNISIIQQLSAGGGPGGVLPDGGGIPIDEGGLGGGPMIASSSQQITSNLQSSGSADTTTLIEQVIKVLERRMNN